MSVYLFPGRSEPNRKFRSTSLNFGNWYLETSNLTLQNKKANWEVDLEKCNTSAQILDYIFWMRTRSNVTDQDLIDLLNAFQCILNPMANFCSQCFPFQVDGKEPEGGAAPIVLKYIRQVEAGADEPH